MICIQIFKYGSPAYYQKVSIQFHEPFHDGFTDEELTDEDGCAYFEFEPGERVSVYVNGTRYIDHERISSRERISI